MFDLWSCDYVNYNVELYPIMSSKQGEVGCKCSEKGVSFNTNWYRGREESGKHIIHTQARLRQGTILFQKSFF